MGAEDETVLNLVPAETVENFSGKGTGTGPSPLYNFATFFTVLPFAIGVGAGEEEAAEEKVAWETVAAWDLFGAEA